MEGWKGEKARKEQKKKAEESYCRKIFILIIKLIK